MAIAYNEPITFGRNGTARALKCHGIDFDDCEDRSWTRAPVAELVIPLQLSRQDILLELEATPFVVPERISYQQVFMFVSGLFVGFATLENSGRSAFLLHRQAISGRDTRVTLVLPTAISPKKLGLGEDMRELGIYISSMLFRA